MGWALAKCPRLYWYTIEFGLIREKAKGCGPMVQASSVRQVNCRTRAKP